MRLITTFCLLVSASLSIFAQTKISGKAFDLSTSIPIEFANVSLLKQDSAFVKGVTTDVNGRFSIEGIEKGDYLLAVAGMGYEKGHIAINNLEKQVDNVEIGLQPMDMKLQDVVVTANSIIRKVDRQLVLPTESQVKASYNGLDLLQRLQLSRLTINQVDKKVTVAGGGDVQLRINGALVTIAEVMAINPQDVIRIEYHDDPGMRYNNAGAVIDYIVKRKQSGGSAVGDMRQGIKSNMGFTDGYLALKLNNRKSEFAVNNFTNYRDIDWVRENTEHFFFPSGVLKRTEQGTPTQFTATYANTTVNYSMQDPDKQYLNVAFRHNYNDNPNGFTDRNSTIVADGDKSPIMLKDHSTMKSTSPSLDVYYQRNLKNEQLLILEVVGTYIDSHSTRLYQENRDDELLHKYFSEITGDKYSLIVEGIYEKNLKDAKLSTGIRHNQSYVKNLYTGDVTEQVGLNMAETYMYGEYQMKKNKFNYTFGAGIMRTSYSQGGNSEEVYTLRPTLRTTYTVNDNLFLRYNGYISSNTPSLGDLSNVTQITDPLQIRRGNPNLKPAWYNSNRLTVGYNKGILNFEFFTQYNYYNKPVMEETLFEDNLFIRTQNNQRAFHRVNIESMFRLKLFKELLNISVRPGLNHYRSIGNNYKHTYTNPYINASVDGIYKNWIASAFFQTKGNWYFGETLEEGESVYVISFGYNKPHWNLKLNSFNLFGSPYERSTRNDSDLAPSLSHLSTNNLSRMIFISFGFNLNFGRQYNAASKRINNNDSDAGMMSGAKK